MSATDSEYPSRRRNVCSPWTARATLTRSSRVNSRSSARSAYSCASSDAVTKRTPGCAFTNAMNRSKSANACSVSAAGRTPGFLHASRGGLAPSLKFTASQNLSCTHSQGW